MNIHIYSPQPTAKGLMTTVCDDCAKRTKMIQFFTPWYGWDSTCIKCGRHWRDGEWMPLDFIRESRQISINAAKKLWRKLPPVSENHYGVE